MQITNATYTAQSVRSLTKPTVQAAAVSRNTFITGSMQMDSLDAQSDKESAETVRIGAVNALNTSAYLSLRDKINPAKDGMFNENEQKRIQ